MTIYHMTTKSGKRVAIKAQSYTIAQIIASKLP